MLNPHQNININISYNLGPDKQSRPLPAKKINKQLKTQNHSSHNAYDIELKFNKKLPENSLKKSNEHRSLNDTKKTKKKLTQPPRNTCTPDLFVDRRIKTQGPSADHDLLSAFKKEGKNKQHYKSVQQPIGKNTQTNKKVNSQSKAPKIAKVGHITSCTMPNWKKMPIDLGQHVASQVICPPPRKKRAHSHSTFMKNDKIVSKLLNVSMLCSQLGGSQPITSERKANISSQSKTLKQYMSSMDMRIIRSMQQDVPIFADKKDFNQPDIIRNIMRSKQISLEELTKKVTLIQRKWKEISKRNVIDTYKVLFQQIVTKIKKGERLSDISGIDHSPEEIQLEQNNAVSLFENEGISSSIRKEIIMVKDSTPEQASHDSFQQLHNIRWIEQSQDINEFNETKTLGLNIKKYRELVDSQLQKKPKSQKCKAKQIYKEQVQQWNSINKQITNIMNYKGQLDSQLLLDELIKQSKNNQYWIDNEFQHLDKEPYQHRRESDPFITSDLKDIRQSSRREEQGSNLLDSLQDREEKDKHKSKFSDSLEEDENQYDKNKYEPIQEPYSQQEDIRATAIESFSIKPHQIPVPVEFVDPQQVFKNTDSEKMWISQQIMEDNVVRNYLDCGLGDFGIDISSRIMQLPEANKGDQPDRYNEEYNSSDEAIGAKFQQANFAAIRQSLEEKPDLQPHFLRKVDNESVDATIEHIVRFLISEFAVDISVILKKASGGAPSEKKPPAQKIQGIQTNFHSIKEYLSKFIAFIVKQEKNLQKVTETINKDIGPSSLEILTYLRPESEEANIPYMDQDDQSFQDQQGLFVVPAELFQHFEQQLEQDYKKEHQKEMGPRIRAYLSFWHRCIFQSYNQCLDYQRPYGIEGKPYEWTIQTKVFRKVERQKITEHLLKAQSRLLDLTSMVGGIIFQKSDSPFAGADLSQQQRHMMNQQRLSRILATELLQSQQSWINYNDEMAELLVELSRMIEQKLFFEYGTELKKLQRRRKIIADESCIEEAVVFDVEEL